jgi:Domain of unknown function (DUF4392)
MAEMLAEYAEYIDRLITVEMRNRGMPHGKIVPLYEAAREEGGGHPLNLRAADGLREHVHPGDTVIIVTGAGAPPLLPKGENDGPVGAAVLAHAVCWGLAATPVFVCERHHVDPVVASAHAVGITIRDYTDASRYVVWEAPSRPPRSMTPPSPDGARSCSIACGPAPSLRSSGSAPTPRG